MILVESVDDLKTKFLQNVRIKFNSSNFPSKTEIKSLSTVISINQIDSTTYELKIKENVNELLKWIHKYDIKRFTCENATLEEIFLQFYE